MFIATVNDKFMPPILCSTKGAKMNQIPKLPKNTWQLSANFGQENIVIYSAVVIIAKYGKGDEIRDMGVELVNDVNSPVITNADNTVFSWYDNRGIYFFVAAFQFREETRFSVRAKFVLINARRGFDFGCHFTCELSFDNLTVGLNRWMLNYTPKGNYSRFHDLNRSGPSKPERERIWISEQIARSEIQIPDCIGKRVGLAEISINMRILIFNMKILSMLI